MTEPLDWREAPIGRHHDRKAFDCGSPELNEYIDRYARQNHESGGEVVPNIWTEFPGF